MIFGSVCSGIEAASVAWHSLGWRAAWFSEIDRAACEVLAYRFPDVPNHGDMLELAGKVRRREIPAPDILVGGTPCQSFSVAGMRGGLSDPRGQLTIAFIDLANAIDEIRAEAGLPPVIIVWENVPGVLSHKDNPFGCFLAGLAGESDALESPQRGGKWSNAGVVLGPERAAAWRILDAQYFGLAQRRRRVFVVASARPGFDPAGILFEFEGVRRDTAPSRDAGEGVAGTLDARATGGGFPGTDGACSGHDVPAATEDQSLGHGAAGDSIRVAGTLDASLGRSRGAGTPPSAIIPVDSTTPPTWWDGRPVSQTLDAVLHKGQTMPEKNRFPAVLHPVTYAFGSKGAGLDTTEELSPTLRASEHAESHSNGGRTPAVAYSLHADAIGRTGEALTPSPDAEGRVRLRPPGMGISEDTSFALTTAQPHAVAYAFQPRIARNGRGDMGDVVNALTAQAGETGKGDAAPCVAYAIQERAICENPAAGPDGIGVRGDGAAYTLEARTTTQAVCVTDPVTHTLKAEGFDASEDGTGRGQPITVYGEHVQLAVRRLMPVECERLQGFPDHWTLVPTGKKGKPAADGPRYKQCGNSMAVNAMRWIGSRIASHLAQPVADDAIEDLLG